MLTSHLSLQLHTGSTKSSVHLQQPGETDCDKHYIYYAQLSVWGAGFQVLLNLLKWSRETESFKLLVQEDKSASFNKCSRSWSHCTSKCQSRKWWFPSLQRGWVTMTAPNSAHCSSSVYKTALMQFCLIMAQRNSRVAATSAGWPATWELPNLGLLLKQLVGIKLFHLESELNKCTTSSVEQSRL